MEFLHSRLKIVEIVLRCLLVFVREGEKKEADAFDLWQNPRLLLRSSSSLRSTSSSVRKQIAECTSLKIPGFGSSGKLERSLESREEELESTALYADITTVMHFGLILGLLLSAFRSLARLPCKRAPTFTGTTTSRLFRKPF